jgi:Fe-S-cluster containining protein
MNKWSEVFGIAFPECKKTGNCCRYSFPSSSSIELIYKAAMGDEFARDYLSIFIPYSNINEVRKLNSGVVEKVLNALQKMKSENVDNMVFYHCRFLAEENYCMIYEDRPSLCREFPDSPLLVLSPGCAYEEWAVKCKEKYNKLTEELEIHKKELENLRYQRKFVRLLEQLKNVSNDKYKTAFILTSLSLVSPGTSWIKRF